VTAPRAKRPRSLVAGPSEPELRRLLGRRYRLFEKVAHPRPGASGEWRRYKKGAAPVLKVIDRRQTLYYVRPDAHSVHVSFLISRRAGDAALTVKLRPRVRAALQSAQEFPEGLAVRLTLQRLAEFAEVEALLAIKLTPA
jgi:hypothetical protein